VVRHVREFDLIYIYREAALLGPPVFERQVYSAGVPIVFDFDDAIFISYVSVANGYLSMLKFGPSKTRAICRMATHIMTGNEYLAKYAGQFNSNVTIIPTTIETSTYTIEARPENRVPVIGWTGSHATIPHLDTLRRALQRLAREEHFRLRVISSAVYRIEGVDVENVPWRSATEVDDLRPIDIGIMPLPDDPWSHGKCAAKALQFMALSTPVVCSPVGVNSTIIQHTQNGFLASSEEDWVRILRMLLHDSRLRAGVGRAGRATVEAQYCASVQAPRVLQVFLSASRPTSQNGGCSGYIPVDAPHSLCSHTVSYC